LRLAPSGDAEAGFTHSAFQQSLALTGPPIARAVWQLHRELQRGDEYTEMTVEGLAYELACRALRGTTLFGGSRTRALRAMARIRTSLRRPPSTSATASELGVSRATLYRDFKSVFGCTPGECLRQARIHVAARALRNSRMTVADIALECGFYDQSHFDRCFRHALGTSPSQFRSGVS
jgi:AraC family transcriptional regulator